MIKRQNIFFDNSLDFNVKGGGIIEHDTKILTLFLNGTRNSNSLCLIGERLEWIPWIWMEFEKEKLEKLNEINIVCLIGDLTEFFRRCQKKFINVKINYYQYNLYQQIDFIKNSLINKTSLPAQCERKNNIYSSIGTMRLNRYILIKESLEKGYDFYYPAISYNISKYYEYQIGQCLGTTMQSPNRFEARRIFKNNMQQPELNKKQIHKFCNNHSKHRLVKRPRR